MSSDWGDSPPPRNRLLPYVPGRGARYEAINCGICGATFQPKAWNTKYCTYACSRRALALTEKSARQERAAKRQLMERLRPGSLRRIEDL